MAPGEMIDGAKVLGADVEIAGDMGQGIEDVFVGKLQFESLLKFALAGGVLSYG